MIWDYLNRDGLVYLCGSVLPLPAFIRSPRRLVQVLSILRAHSCVLTIYSSSTNMPKAVKKALLAIFASEGGLDPEAAEKHWESLEKAGRIVEETWG